MGASHSPSLRPRSYFRVLSVTAGKAGGSRLTGGHCLDPVARGPRAVPGSWACDGTGRTGTSCTIKRPTCPSQAQGASSCCCAHLATENGVSSHRHLTNACETHTHTGEWRVCPRLTPALRAGSHQHSWQHTVPTTLGAAWTR